MRPADAPRSYIVEGQSGMLRRHRSHLRAVPSQTREIRDCIRSRVARVFKPPRLKLRLRLRLIAKTKPLEFDLSLMLFPCLLLEHKKYLLFPI